ncbi:hypothetical protein ACN6MY_19765 [Peribacillus sp. B-H-3]|uniref:hypothetical protein n=1 Tax=Peribacillus sp. B-H-3 TaxID=3400420 RepID=UPI003B01707A
MNLNVNSNVAAVGSIMNIAISITIFTIGTTVTHIVIGMIAFSVNTIKVLNKISNFFVKHPFILDAFLYSDPNIQQ